MEFLKYGDCPLELQNLGRAKLMLELSPCTVIEKQSLRSENTDMPGTDKSPTSEQVVFPESVKTWIRFPIPLKQLVNKALG